MFLEYFGFSFSPFSTRTFFNSERYSAILDYLIDKINQGQPILVHGNEGTGKTSLVQTLLLKSSRMGAYYIVSPDTQCKDLESFVAKLMTLKKTRSLSTSLLLNKISEAFKASTNFEEGLLLVFDHAENLNDECLTFLDGLSRYLCDERFSIILIGSGSRLSPHSFKQFSKHNKRLEYQHDGFNVQECHAFISSRISEAGGGRELVDRAGARMIHKASGGRPGTIAQITENALRCAFIDRSPVVKPRHLSQALTYMGLPSRSRSCFISLMLIYALLGSVIGWTYYQYAAPFLTSHLFVAPSLKEVPAPALRIEDMANDKRDGIKQLFHIWGYDVPLADAFCDQADRAQLVCKEGKGTLDELVAGGQPWLASMNIGNKKIYAGVVRITDRHIDLLIKDKTWTVERNWFNAVWSGDFIQFQLTTPDGKKTINQNSSLEDTVWLDAVLSNILHLPPGLNGEWDTELKDKIKLFQKREGLNVDSQVGPGTLQRIAKSLNKAPELIVDDGTEGKR